VYHPTMRPWRAFTEMVHLVALGLWLGSLVMAAATAAVVFPTVKSLDPRLPGFAAYTGDHWLLAAGHVGERVFTISYLIAFPCSLAAIITLAALVLLFRLPRTRPAVVLRIVALVIAVAAFAAQLLVVSQSMNASLRAYWAAAQAGQNDVAARHQAAFQELHPMASTLMAITGIGVLVALGAGAWSAGAGEGDGGRAQSGPVLEEPALVREGR
jgi:hypothetical protein